MTIFDATLFSGKPAAGTGMQAITKVSESLMVNGDFSQAAGPPPLYMDAERLTPEQTVARRAEIQAIYPGKQIGAYSIFPLFEYWSANKPPESKRYHEWLQRNKARHESGSQMDLIMPSCYTFYNDPAGWAQTFTEFVKEARKFGREIMPFLWFDYHDQSTTPNVYIGDDYWRDQIKLSLDLTGNAIIWGGWNLEPGTSGPKVWDDNAPWYQVVKEFL